MIRKDNIYLLIIVRKRKVLVRIITADIVNKVKEICMAYKGDLNIPAHVSGLSPKLISTAIKILRVKGEIKN